MRLTDEMKEMVERLRLCYVAAVTPDKFQRRGLALGVLKFLGYWFAIPSWLVPFCLATLTYKEHRSAAK
jgi:hypothetical protein